MRISLEDGKRAGAVKVSGALTHSCRTLQLRVPDIQVDIDPADVEEEPDAWVDPLQSERIIDAVVDSIRAWLVKQAT